MRFSGVFPGELDDFQYPVLPAINSTIPLLEVHLASSMTDTIACDFCQFLLNDESPARGVFAHWVDLLLATILF